MERTISILAAAVIAAALATAQTPAQPAPVEAAGRLILPPGTRLDPSQTYDADITIGGRRVSARFTG